MNISFCYTKISILTIYKTATFYLHPFHLCNSLTANFAMKQHAKSAKDFNKGFFNIYSI
jgi:hypothetical protein